MFWYRSVSSVSVRNRDEFKAPHPLPWTESQHMSVWCDRYLPTAISRLTSEHTELRESFFTVLNWNEIQGTGACQSFCITRSAAAVLEMTHRVPNRLNLDRSSKTPFGAYLIAQTASTASQATNRYISWGVCHIPN